MSLTPEQFDAASSRASRLLCLAAPGSGKTRVLVARVVDILATHHPSEVLALTFTRRAAAEMRERLVDQVGPRGKLVTLSTFHSWAARTIRAYADRLGWDPRFSIRDDQDRSDLIVFVGQELGLKWKSAKRLWQETDVQRRYRVLLREAQAMDYDMLETELLRLLDLPDVAAELRSRLPHVLVDEGQDTSTSQQAILDALAPRNLFVVGDFAQSIYGFRGAYVDGFVGLGLRPGWETAILATNFRSAPAIVAEVTRIGQGMHPQGLVQRPAPGGGLDIWHYQRVGEITAVVRSGYLAAICDDLRNEHDKEGAAWSSMAVLAPTWHQLHVLAEALTTAGIPHRLAKASTPVWATAETRWAMAALRVAVNPHDHLALYAVLTAWGPTVSAGEWSAMRLATLQRSAPALEVAAGLWGGPGNARGRLVAGLDAACARLANDDAGAALLGLLAVLSGYVDDLHLTTRAEGLVVLGDAIAAWAAERIAAGEPAGLTELLDWWACRAIDHDPEPAEAPDVVTLSTIHGAKGLEWDQVWVLGAEPGSLPRDDEKGPTAEERRLLYVAASRARARLRYCWSAHRGRSCLLAQGSAQPATPLPTESAPGFPLDPQPSGELAQLVDAAERGRQVDTAPSPGLPDPFVQLLLGTFWLACWLYGTTIAPAAMGLLGVI